ncbi:MAG: STT3 domain-containing protein [Candidatus Nanoarchaeia archaeon]|nr:STT3 domain-containing protein [Candidatus Nanoarchaeia archaeon]MDD5239255.1 STT3 domain-containing protein [Candidatus Nanoarchaeia archaeon]
MEENKTTEEEVSIDVKHVIAWLSSHKKVVVWGLLLLIIGLAFFSRIQNIPLLEGKYLVSPDDPYYFLRASNTIYETGSLPENDTLRYYPDGQDTKAENNFMAYLAGYSLKAVKIFAPSATMFDIAAWMAPTLLVIGLVGFFLLSREIFEDDRIALIATGFLAFSSAIFFRTTAGFLEKEPILLPMFCFAMLFFVMAYKRTGTPRYIWAAIGGLFTALAGFASGLFAFIYLYIGLFVLAEVALQKMNKEKLFVLAIWFGVTTVILSLLTTKYGSLLQPFSLFAPMQFKIVLAALVIAAIYCFVPQPKSLGAIPKGVYAVMVGGLVLFAGGIIILGFDGMSEIFSSIGTKLLNPAGTDRMSLSVSENQAPTFIGRGWWGTFGVSFVIPIVNQPVTIGILFLLFAAGSLVLFYNEFKFSKYRWILLAAFALFMSSLIFENIGSNNFGWIEILLGNQLVYTGLFAGILLMFLFLERDKDEKFSKINSILLFVLMWFTVSTVAANGAVRLFFMLAFSLMLIAAYFVVWCIDRIKQVEKYAWLQYVVYAVAILIVAASFNVAYQSNKNMYPGLANWYEATGWIANNTEPSDVFTSWWDYGYLIQTMGGRATVGDPANFYAMRNYDIGGYLFNSKNNSEALKFLDKYSQPDYLLICTEDVFKFYQIARLGSLSTLYGELPEGQTLGREAYFSSYALKDVKKIVPNTIYESDKYPSIAILEPTSGPSQLLETFRSGSNLFDGDTTFITGYLALFDENQSYGPLLVQLYDSLTQRSEILPAGCECIQKQGCFDLNISNAAPVCYINYKNGAILNVPYKARNVLFTDLYLLDRDVPGFEKVYTNSVPMTIDSIHGQGTNVQIYKYNYTELENNPGRFE